MARLRDYTAEVSSKLKGADFIRYAQTLAASGRDGRAGARRIAQDRDDSEVVLALRSRIDADLYYAVLKGAVDPGTSTDANFASALVQYTNMASEFAAALRPATLVGRMSGLREVPFQIRYPKQTGTATVNWVQQFAPAPASALAFQSATLGFARAAGLIIVTKELAAFASPPADQLLRNELLKATANFLDRQFIDPSIVAVADQNPASITHGITPVESSGPSALEIAADLASMLGTMADSNVPFAAPWFVMRPADAAKLAAKRSTTGGIAFLDITVRGGMLLGVPVLCSNAVPASVSGGSIIVLVDASCIDYAGMDQLVVDTSEESSVIVDSAPGSGAQQAVSLWQNALVCWRVTSFANWARRFDPAVSYLDGVFL